MHFQAVERTSAGRQIDRTEELALQIARLVRHPSYDRGQVVSGMLQRFLPSTLHPSRHPDDLRRRLDAGGLDRRALDHLLANVEAEIAMARARG